LSGNGTVAGAVTVNAGGTVAPGASIGTLTCNQQPDAELWRGGAL